MDCVKEEQPTDALRSLKLCSPAHPRAVLPRLYLKGILACILAIAMWALL